MDTQELMQAVIESQAVMKYWRGGDESYSHVEEAVYNVGVAFLKIINLRTTPLVTGPPERDSNAKSSGKKLPFQVRLEVFKRHGFACLMCGAAEDLVVDHIIPRSKGGSNLIDNLQPLCGRCNSQKGAKHPNP